ncbi:MAG: DUF3109 family protein [FCB group bacterium]|jgi:hypothetical protein
MILIENILLTEEILDSYFACDLPKCKGACCTFPGEFGAPLLNEEVDLMYEALEPASEYLSGKSIEYIEKHGIIAGIYDDYSTVCINKRDCVFVFYENGIAKCSIEKTFFTKKTNFRKPISCHLFPLRVSKTDGNYLYYQKIDECFPGEKKGKAEYTPLYLSLKEALIRTYGTEWYNTLIEYINDQKNQNHIAHYSGGLDEIIS